MTLLRLAALSSLALTTLVACSSSSGLAAPTGVTATANTDGSITVAWTAVSGEGYLIERGTAAGAESTTPIATVPSTSAGTYNDLSGLTAGTTYYYVVVATEAGESNSAASSEAHATALAPAQDCQTACARIVACGSSGGSVYGAGFGYSGDTFYGNGGYGGGAYAYGYSGQLTSSQCINDCNAAASADQARIVACIFGSNSCATELSCE